MQLCRAALFPLSRLAAWHSFPRTRGNEWSERQGGRGAHQRVSMLDRLFVRAREINQWRGARIIDDSGLNGRARSDGIRDHALQLQDT
jgi:hypothetical protein